MNENDGNIMEKSWKMMKSIDGTIMENDGNMMEKNDGKKMMGKNDGAIWNSNGK